MNEQPDRIEQDAQRLICRGEDLLDRTHALAQDILKRVSQVIDSQAPQLQASVPDEADSRR